MVVGWRIFREMSGWGGGGDGGWVADISRNVRVGMGVVMVGGGYFAKCPRGDGGGGGWVADISRNVRRWTGWGVCKWENEPCEIVRLTQGSRKVSFFAM